jgi:voltage-gated potassium channel
MAYIETKSVNDPGSSPSTGFDLVKVLPLALGLFNDLGPGSDYALAKTKIRAWAKEDPIDALAAVVIGGGLAFYLAERDTNPGCKNPWDGILYMSTALSVGYDNLFPTTVAGHALATFAQTFGPSLADNALEPPAAETRAAEAAALARAQAAAEVDRQILARLEDIVRLLETKSS